jgi:hypothetical protein
MKILITENQSSRVNKLLNESRSGLLKILKNYFTQMRKNFSSNPIGKVLTDLSSTTTRNGKSWDSILDSLIKSGQLNTQIKYGNFTGKITEVKHLSGAFYGGMLSKEDAALVIKTIINNSNNLDDISKIAKYIVKSDKGLRNAAKGKNESQIKSLLTNKGYEGGSIESITNELVKNAKSGSIPGFVWSGVKDWSNSPKLYQILYKSNIGGQSRLKVLSKWLLTGTTRKDLSKSILEVTKSFIKGGVSIDAAKPLIKLLTSFSVEAILRWMTLNIALTLADLVIMYFKEYGTEETDRRSTEELIDLVSKDFWDNFITTPFGWVIPARTVIPAVNKIVSGIFYRKPPLEIYDDMKKGKLPEQRELKENSDEINRVIESKDEKDSQIEEIYNSFDSSNRISDGSSQIDIDSISGRYPSARFEKHMGTDVIVIDSGSNIKYWLNPKNNTYYKRDAIKNRHIETGKFNIIGDEVRLTPSGSSTYTTLT